MFQQTQLVNEVNLLAKTNCAEKKFTSTQPEFGDYIGTKLIYYVKLSAVTQMQFQFQCCFYDQKACGILLTCFGKKTRQNLHVQPYISKIISTRMKCRYHSAMFFCGDSVELPRFHFYKGEIQIPYCNDFKWCKIWFIMSRTNSFGC